MHGGVEQTRRLLSAGADEGLANKGEVTPLDLATDPAVRAALIEIGVRSQAQPLSSTLLCPVDHRSQTVRSSSLTHRGRIRTPRSAGRSFTRRQTRGTRLGCGRC